MGKPPRAVYDAFCDAFEEINHETGKKQFVVPYLMSSHPGSTLAEAIELAEYVPRHGLQPRAGAGFLPHALARFPRACTTPGSILCTMEPIYVPKTSHEKALQRALIQYRNPDNYDLVREALTKAGRTDLIGWDKQCLIRPKRPKKREVEDGGAPRKGEGEVCEGRAAKGAPSSRPGPASAQRAGKPPKANGRKGGIRKGR